MHIQQLHIDGITHQRDLSVQDLTPGFNVIYGAPASGKTGVAEFVHALLFGRRTSFDGAASAAGSAVIGCQSGRYRLSRQRLNSGQGPLTAKPHDSVSPERVAEQLVPRMSERLYEKAFQAGFRRGCDIDGAVAEAEAALTHGSADTAAIYELERQLSVAESRRAEWLRSEHGDSPLDVTTRQTEHLRNEIAELENHWTDHNQSAQHRRLELEQLAVVREGALANASRQLDSLDEEIAAIEAEHQELLRQYEELQRNTDETLSNDLEAKLNKITEQMLRWNRVLADLIERRDRIRTELVEWATGDEQRELGGPAGRIAAMEQLIGDVRSQIKSFEKGQKASSHCGCHKLHDNCTHTLRDLRDHLYELCEELSRQQYRYRRNAMNSELKQLRRCHGEVTQYLQRLVKRRNQLLRRLGEADPAALARVVREQRELCDVEDNEALFDLVSIKSFEFAGDWEAVQRRLGEIDYQLEELRSNRVDAHRESEQHRSQLAEIRAELNAVGSIYDVDAALAEKRRDLARLKERQTALQAEWRQLNDDANQTIQRLEQQRAGRHKVNILAEASHYLRELTSNDFVAVRRSAQTGRLVVESRGGKTYVWEALAQQTRDMTHLGVCLAAGNHLFREGVACPLILDDLFAHVDDDRVSVVAGVLKRYADSGRQILATTGWDSAAARCESIGVNVRRLNTTLAASIPTAIKTSPVVNTPAVLEQLDVGEPIAAEPATQPTFGDGIPDDTYYLERTDPIEETPDLEHDAAVALRSHGVDTVGEFLGISADDLRTWSNVRMTPAHLRHCQAMGELLCDVINLRPYDVRILVGAGIHDASQLRRMTSEQLLSRVESYVRTTEGRAILVSGDDFELARVANWIRSARESREFHRETERQQALRQAKQKSRISRDPGQLSVYGQRGSKTRRSSASRPKVSPSSKAGGTRASRPTTQSTNDANGAQTAAGDLRFHLNRDSDVEAAPSIGPKMAEHLEKVGVSTVGDLLSSAPEQVADDLDHRRVNVDTVRLWQRQAEWVCRVPELRGHDAQLLVACGYETVENLDNVSAEDLFDAVKAISDTKDGRRILRGGKKPDLAEINNWLQWSKHSRQLRAA